MACYQRLLKVALEMKAGGQPRRLALQMDTCGNTMHCKSTDVLGANYAELYQPEAFIWLNGLQACV